MVAKHPDKPSGALVKFWDRPVSNLAQVDEPVFSDPCIVERHRIFCLLLMRLVSHYWNGNKYGETGTYRDRTPRSDGRYPGGNYYGHNIACLAVDGSGDIIDFDFNHNDLFQSSVEHAESRLIRRLFSLTQVHDTWRTRTTPPTSYAGLLDNVTIYTSLESCAQCAGIMALASLGEVVFIQRDPGQNSVGNILYNLAPRVSGSRYHAAYPIPASAVGLPAFAALEAGYAQFVSASDDLSSNTVRDPAFHQQGTVRRNEPSITSFLCTDPARKIFDDAASEFDTLVKTVAVDPSRVCSQNVGSVQRAASFRDYAIARGYRGTPHKL